VKLFSLAKTHFNLFDLLIGDILDVRDVACVSRTENDEEKAEQYHKHQQKYKILRSHH
jgi:hypothetical protein